MFKHRLYGMSLELELKQQKPFSNPYEKLGVNLMYTTKWFESQLKDYFKSYDLTSQQYNIMRILAGAKKPVSTSFIRERLIDKNSDVSRIVDRMEKKSLLVKTTCSKDRRLVDVELNAEGKDLLESINKNINYVGTLLSELNAKEVEILNQLLDKIRNKLLKFKMMRTLLFALFFGSSLLASANGDPVSRTVEVNAADSQISWVGKKVTGKHEGTIKVKSGNLEYDDKGNLTGGKIIIDMTSIECTDMKGGGAEKLVGHLNSDDFFSVANHPEATIVFTEVKSKGDNMFSIMGDLTIKGQTNSIKFDANLSHTNATATLSVDRTKYGIRYGSGSFFDNLGDKTINDEFVLDINLSLSVL